MMEMLFRNKRKNVCVDRLMATLQGYKDKEKLPQHHYPLTLTLMY